MALQARLKLTFWPPPSSDHLLPHTDEAPVEVEPSQLPSTGVFLQYVSTAPPEINVIELPRGSLIKVPVACSNQRCLQVTVTGPPGQQHVLTVRALEDLVEGEDGLVPAPGRTLRWQLEGVAALHAANFVEAGNQMCIERCAPLCRMRPDACLLGDIVTCASDMILPQRCPVLAYLTGTLSCMGHQACKGDPLATCMLAWHGGSWGFHNDIEIDSVFACTALQPARRCASTNSPVLLVRREH